jgi:hypothetical protein
MAEGYCQGITEILGDKPTVVRSEVLLTVKINTRIVWDVTPCTSVNRHQTFETAGNFHLHHSLSGWQTASLKTETACSYKFHTCLQNIWRHIAGNIKIQSLVVRNVTGKVVPVHAISAHMGNRDITPLILSVSTRLKWDASFTAGRSTPEGEKTDVMEWVGLGA